MRFSKLYTIGHNAKSSSDNFNSEMDNIYSAINTVDTEKTTMQATVASNAGSIDALNAQMGLVALGQYQMRPVTFQDLKTKAVTFGMLRAGRVPFFTFQFWRFPQA